MLYIYKLYTQYNNLIVNYFLCDKMSILLFGDQYKSKLYLKNMFEKFLVSDALHL